MSKFPKIIIHNQNHLREYLNELQINISVNKHNTIVKVKEKNFNKWPLFYLLREILVLLRKLFNGGFKTIQLECVKSDLWVFFGTTNQKRIYDLLNLKIEHDLIDLNSLKTFNAKKFEYFYIWFCFIMDVVHQVRRIKTDNFMLLNTLNAYLQACVLFYDLRKVFNKTGVRINVLMNDHSLYNRVILYASKSMLLKTVFIPHASNSLLFPKLISDFNFLDNDRTYNNYKTIGISDNCKIIKIGNIKYSYIKSHAIVKKTKQKLKILLAINGMEDFNEVSDIIKFLRNEDSIELILRPHPNFGKKLEMFRQLDDGLIVDGSSNIYEVLNKMDLVVCHAASNIALEAAFAGCRVLLVSMGIASDRQDYYGFLSEKIFYKQIETNDFLTNYIPKIIKNSELCFVDKRNLHKFNYAYDLEYSEIVTRFNNYFHSIYKLK